MISANLATYPPRRNNLLPVVRAIAPQVDRLNVVLNEYDGTLADLEAFPNVVQIVPPVDTKDTGKFLPPVEGAAHVFLIDDDLVYPADFVARTVAAFEALGAGFVGGYHGSIYVRPPFSLKPRRLRRWLTYSSADVADHRRRLQVQHELAAPLVVDQIATNAAILRGADMPPFAYMKDSQKFVDVRLARWCFDRSLRPVLLPRPANWIGQVRFEETIYQGFTLTNPPAVAEEIMHYAFKVPGRGAAP